MITACYVLHYGREWIMHSIESVRNLVDSICLFATPTPSFGFTSNIPNPEPEHTRLFDMARLAAMGTKISCWDLANIRFTNEGQHRTFAVNKCFELGADVVVVVDADELWPVNVLSEALKLVVRTSARTFRIGMRHAWRSLYWICDDPACPTRFIRKPGTYDKEEEYLPGKVYHMGYAQTPALVKYKMSIHGHKAEIRPGWFENVFMKWTPEVPYGDVHPTNADFWNPVRHHDFPYFDPKWTETDELNWLTYRPHHPYRDIELIT